MYEIPSWVKEDEWNLVSHCIKWFVLGVSWIELDGYIGSFGRTESDGYRGFA